LPEVLTRDITSPIKEAVEGLDGIIKEYERRQMEDRLLPLLPNAWHAEIRYYTLDEFSNRVKNAQGIRSNLSFADLERDYNDGHDMPVDGEIIRCCDHLAALSKRPCLSATASVQSTSSKAPNASTPCTNSARSHHEFR
jgi:putative hydrolase of HD superfamily